MMIGGALFGWAIRSNKAMIGIGRVKKLFILHKMSGYMAVGLMMTGVLYALEYNILGMTRELQALVIVGLAVLFVRKMDKWNA